MMRAYWMVWMLTLSSCAVGAAEGVKPDETVYLEGGTLRAQIIINPSHLIDGYGPRFDNTAMVSNVWLRDKPYLKDGCGLIDEFGIEGDGVLNYDSAAQGGSFVKIGVGELTRIDDKPYAFYTVYPVKRLWPVQMTRTDSSVTLHQVAEAVDGYAYDYQKTYTLDAKQHTLTIQYSLKNTGSKAWHFEQYNHCFVQMTHRLIGPDYHVMLDRELPVEKKFAKFVSMTGGVAQILAPPAKPWRLVSATTKPSTDGPTTIRHAKTGQTMTLTDDFATNRVVLYAQEDAICPEIFAAFDVPPGQTQTWRRTFEFGHVE